MRIKSKEEIFDQQAMLGMIKYNPRGFKLKYSTLYQCILNAMETYKNQAIGVNITR